MNADEEALQDAVEKDTLGDAGGLDARAYREVFRVLKAPAEAPLPAGFAERVAQKIVSRRQKEREWRDYLWYAIGVLLLAGAALGTVRYAGVRLDLQFMDTLVDYKAPLLFGVALIIVFNWLDQRLVKRWLDGAQRDHDDSH